MKDRGRKGGEIKGKETNKHVSTVVHVHVHTTNIKKSTCIVCTCWKTYIVVSMHNYMYRYYINIHVPVCTCMSNSLLHGKFHVRIKYVSENVIKIVTIFGKSMGYYNTGYFSKIGLFFKIAITQKALVGISPNFLYSIRTSICIRKYNKNWGG